MAPWTPRWTAVGGRLAATVTTPRWTAQSRRGLLLRVEDGSGMAGLGEASPLPGYSRETLAACEEAFERFPWDTLPDPTAPDALDVLGCADVWIELPAAARFAIETAWLDLAGQHRRVPLATLLGAPPHAAIPVSALLLSEEPDGAALEGAHAVRSGIGTVKLKVSGADFDHSVARLAAVRKRCGNGLRIRLDANGSLPPADALGSLRELAAYAPELIEEPVASSELRTIEGSPVPIALDESLQDPDALQHLETWLTAGPCTAVVLKPAALGGFVRCVRLAREAAAHGLRATVSHLFDGPIALRAAQQLALAIADPVLASGVGPHAGIEAYDSAGSSPELRERRSAVFLAGCAPGLGLEGPDRR